MHVIMIKIVEAIDENGREMESDCAGWRGQRIDVMLLLWSQFDRISRAIYCYPIIAQINADQCWYTMWISSQWYGTPHYNVM